MRGSAREQLTEAAGGSVNVLDGWIYYLQGQDYYRMRTNGSGQERLPSADLP